MKCPECGEWITYGLMCPVCFADLDITEENLQVSYLPEDTEDDGEVE